MTEIESQLRGKAQTTALAALEVVPFAMVIADASAHALAVNSRWMDLAGLGRANSLGPGWLSVLEPDSRARLREDVIRVARDGEQLTVDYPVGASPHSRWTRWWISRHDLEGVALVAIAAADVDDDYARQANLYHLATHDSLTGLINRSHFIECIDQALRRSQRQSRHVAVVYVDLDGFKRVNDRGGHSLGDRVLFAIASRLRHAVRSADMVARIGGDEFAVLCEGLNAATQADVVARRIAAALTESVELDGERWSVAASVGAAVDRGEPDSAEELVDRADRAMYTVKLTRRNPSAPDSPATPEDDTFGAAARPASPSLVQPAAGPAEGFDEPHRGESGRDGLRRPDVRGDEAQPAYEPDRSRPAGRSAPGLADEDEARRALRNLAAAASALQHAPSPDPAPSAAAGVGSAEVGSSASGSAVATETGTDSSRQRLAGDVVQLRKSIDSIREMLDRLLDAEKGIIDIRDLAGPEQ